MKNAPQNDGKILIQDLFAAQRKERRKMERKKWLSIHMFDILNLIISLVALIVSFFGLFLPRI